MTTLTDPAVKRLAITGVAAISIAIAVSLPAMIIWRGYVMSVLWRWFAVPAFGVSPLSIPMVIGLSILANVLVVQMPPKEDKEGKIPFWRASVGFWWPAMALAMGYAVTWWMP